jgi:hypothetical protein
MTPHLEESMPAATAKLSKHYDTLSGAERFVASIEAMARGDAAEEERLDESCPRRSYEIDEPAYRRRMSVSFTCAAMACMSLLRDLDALRAVAVVREVAGVFRAFAAETAEEAFHEGWYERGQLDGGGGADGGGTGDCDGEDEAVDAAGTEGANDVDDDAPPLGDGTDAEDGDLGPAGKAAVARVRKHASDVLDIAVRIVDRREGRRRSVSLLSAWEGLGRFTRECCGVEPLTLLKAWRLLAEDPAAEVRRLYPHAKADEGQTANWHASLAGAWERHAAGL